MGKWKIRKEQCSRDPVYHWFVYLPSGAKVTHADTFEEAVQEMDRWATVLEPTA